MAHCAQALNAICNVGGKEFAEALSIDVLKLLTSNMTRTYVRKKAPPRFLGTRHLNAKPS